MTFRRLAATDLDAIDGLKPADWPPFRGTFERYFRLSCCSPFGVFVEDRLLSMGTLIEFLSADGQKKTGWVAQLITDERARGQGLGTAILNHLLQEARRRGLATVSLVATDQGFPLYEKAGFRVEGEYSFWTRKAGPAPHDAEASRRLTSLDGSLSAAAELDAQATGEIRQTYWQPALAGALAGPSGFAGEGFYLPAVGEGLVVAKTPRAGIPLLHRRLDGSDRCVVPTENTLATEVLAARGFTELRRARRMVLGPTLIRKPEWVWSRIGGNLG